MQFYFYPPKKETTNPDSSKPQRNKDKTGQTRIHTDLHCIFDTRKNNQSSIIDNQLLGPPRAQSIVLSNPSDQNSRKCHYERIQTAKKLRTPENHIQRLTPIVISSEGEGLANRDFQEFPEPQLFCHSPKQYQTSTQNRLFPAHK